MENQNVDNTATQSAAAAVENEVMEVSEAIEVACGGAEENPGAPTEAVDVEVDTEEKLATASGPEAVQLGSDGVGVTTIGVEEKLENDGGSGGVAACSVASGGGVDTSAKRKRGRPRKQPGGVAERERSPTPQKRARGRPKGSGKWQTLAASLGGASWYFAGTDFTPYVLTVEAGENIVEKICSFCQTDPAESMCILSACGTVSSAAIRIPASRTSILRYEGQFTIIYLNGSHTYNERLGAHAAKNYFLSVQLADPEGRLYGGSVAGSLVAASPTQLVVATFKHHQTERTNSTYPLKPSKPYKAVATGGSVPSQDTNGTAPLAPSPGVAPVPGPPVDEMEMSCPYRNHGSPQPPSVVVSECVTPNVDASNS